MAMGKIERGIESYLKFLCRKAQDLGASEAIAMPVTDIVVDERTRLKCLVPLCFNYGTNLMCPPNVMPVSEFKNILKGYHRSILVKVDAVLPEPPEELTGQNDLSEVVKMVKSATGGKEQPSTPVTEYLRALRDNQERLYKIISQIESLCLAEGYPFVAGLSGGGCSLCDECVGVKSGLPCRHPFKARPSMEGMGIDVIATAKRAGMHLNFAPNAAKSWVGLILVD